ncbi:DUF6985 domain-containing protein [Amycolatopsis sp. cmx-4-54]|uniref:DUF6985 domain-containing protein n=1 Tax=Amycolatopsis sp. cmx-4-54 TaxID=2790936 RepID=UPI00397B73DA
MEIPGLGQVALDTEFGWYRSQPLAVPVLGGALCSIVLEGYDDDQRPGDFHEAIHTFLTLNPSVLVAATPAIFAYYRDVMNELVAAGDEAVVVEVDGPHSVLDHVRLGDEPIVSRDVYGDRHVYVSLECECDWEPEHGLQIVLRDGRSVTKVGPYDGHLTNSAAYADNELEGVVYQSH